MIVVYLHGLGTAWPTNQTVSRQWLHLLLLRQANGIEIEYPAKGNSRCTGAWTAIPVEDPSKSYGGVVWPIVHESVGNDVTLETRGFGASPDAFVHPADGWGVFQMSSNANYARVASVYNGGLPTFQQAQPSTMSSAVYPAPGGPRNVLQMTHNMLATENVTVTQLWATTLVPTSSPVSASVMLVAPQHSGHFPWFLIKSPIINFVRSFQPTPVEHDRRTFALTWADWANAAQFSVDGRIFLLSFRDSAMFWCFKYMVHCRDQVDRHWHHVSELNAKALLDAFLDFKIPAEVPLGIRSGIQGVEIYEQHANTFFRGFLKYHDKGVSTSTDEVVTASSEHSAPQFPASEGSMGDGAGGTDEHVPGPTVPDIRPAAAALLATINGLHTPRSQPIVTGDSAGGTSGPNPDLIPLDVQPAADALLCLSATDQGTSRLTVTSSVGNIGHRRSRLSDPMDSGEGSPDCDVMVHHKKRKLI